MENKQEKNVLDQIDLLSMIKDVARQWLIIILCSAAVSLLVNVYKCYTYVPEYTVNTTFAVTAKGMSNNIYSNLNTTISMAEEMKLIMDSSILKKRVAEELGMSSFAAKTNVEVVSETNMVVLTVKSGSALNAYRIMKAILNNYTDISDYVIQNAILEIIQAPTIPTSVSNPLNTRSPMKKAGLATAAMLIALFAFLSFLKDTVKNEAEVKEKIDCRFLGSVYHENKKRGLKKKKSQIMLITNPFLSFRFIESNKMIASKIRSRMENYKMKTILVTSVMENEGKSTVAANIALALAQENKKVLLIDFDFRKPAQYKIFDMKEEETNNLPEIIRNKTGFNTLIKKHDKYPLYMMFNSTPTFSMETEINSDTFSQILDFCKQKMDYVIIDSSPMALVSDTEEIAHFCDGSVIVIRQDYVLGKDINDTIDILNRSRARVIGCVFNNVRAGILPGTGNYGYGGHYGKYGK